MSIDFASGLGLVGASLLLLCLSAPVSQVHASPVAEHGQLQVEGNVIVGEHGDPVTLGGMSLFWSQWGEKYYNPKVVAWLVKDWEIDVIRVAMAVHHEGYIENPEAEQAKAELIIETAIREGIYVILDWHAHDPEPEAAAEFFGRMAAKYGGHPNLIYETWNEPLRHHDWASVIKPYHEQVVAAIREHDPDNLILLGTRMWSQAVDEAALDQVDDPNAAYVLHFYAGSHQEALRDQAQRALDQGVALFVSEWGTSMANGDDGVFAEETRRWMQWLDERHISRVNWSVHDKDESSAALLPGASTRGGWGADELSESGQLLRSLLRGE